jgi:hypothetical protein
MDHLYDGWSRFSPYGLRLDHIVVTLQPKGTQFDSSYIEHSVWSIWL